MELPAKKPKNFLKKSSKRKVVNSNSVKKLLIETEI